MHGPGVHPDPVARDPVRPGNSDLCFRWDGRSRRPSRASRSTASRSSSGPCRAKGAGGAGTSVYFRDPDGSLLELIAYD